MEKEFTYSFLDLIKQEEDDSQLSLLYPEVPDHYFDDTTDIIFKKEDSNNITINPFIRTVDLNEQTNQNSEFDETSPKNAWMIGLQGTF